MIKDLIAGLTVGESKSRYGLPGKMLKGHNTAGVCTACTFRVCGWPHHHTPGIKAWIRHSN